MAASDVALSLAILRLLDLRSKFKDIIIYKNLRDQILEFISNVQMILSTRKHVELNHGHSQETQEGEQQLLICAHNAEKSAEAFLVHLLRDRMWELQEDRFAKVFAPVWLSSVTRRACARKKMAKDFMMEGSLLRSKFTSSRPPANESMLDTERASSLSSSKRNLENMRQMIESDIVGRDEEVKKLSSWLIANVDSNLRVISVVGEQACGKTTLVRSVFSMLEIKHHFDCRTWVHFTGLGEKSDRMKNLLTDILKQMLLGDQAKYLENKQEEQLFEMLHKSLMGLRYLIVLDNLSEASLINELLVPFVDSMNGSRVIVTTTNAEMQKFADPWTPDLRLRPDMTKEESKKLLPVSIPGYDDSKTNSILSKFNRSFPAFSLLGGLLSTAEVDWDALINRLGDHPTLDNVMHLSFDQLPHMMKLCALYMALFPKESEVPTRRLFRLWAAEGLLAEDADRLLVSMPSAEDCLCELECRNLLRVVRRKVDGHARSCRVPALVHEFFCQKAKELGFLQIQYSSNSVFKADQNAQYEQKQVQNIATGHYGYKVRCLDSFALFSTRKLGTKAKMAVLLKLSILDERLIFLRVLDLEGVYKPVLPKKLGNILRNLRYLGLRWTVLDFIPESVGSLLFLETLDLKHTNITKVTSSIWKTKTLQHLYLSEASFDKSIQCQISSEKSPYTKLETLWGLFIETADSPMIRWLKWLPSLKKLGVTCHPGAVKAVTEYISQLERLESLRLRSRDLYGQPLQALRLRSSLFGQPASLDLSDMTGATSLSHLYLLGSLRSVRDLLSVLPGNLKVLTLSMSEINQNPMPVLGRLKNLIILKLLAHSYTGEELWCIKTGFPNLRVLKLWRLEELLSLFVEKGSMDNLEELEIRQCQKLRAVYIFHTNSLKSVSLTGVKVQSVFAPQRTIVTPKELKVVF